MKVVLILPMLISCICRNSKVSEQTIFEQYFGGNKDSMIKEAMRLIQIPDPTFNPINQPNEPDSVTIADRGFEPVYKSEKHYFQVRDNKKIYAYKIPKQSPNTIILIHGVASNAYLYNKTAGLLQLATQAEGYAIDLREHGQSEGNNGDVEYINQYTDDLRDIISTIRKEKPNGNVIIAGHSMGGGMALPYAIEKQYPQPDGFLLFAPFTGHNTPAIGHREITENENTKAFLKIHIERIIGLKMLNETGNHEQDHLHVLSFNLPGTIPKRKYSYRANMSMAPDDYAAGLQAVNKPMVILVRSKDEVFSAVALQKAIMENSNGEVYIVEGATHNGIRHHMKSFKYIAQWFSKR